MPTNVLGFSGGWRNVTGTSSRDSATSIVGLTPSRALATDSQGTLVVSQTTTTELSYSSGVTSSIQTQLNSKMSSTEPSFTGNVNVSGRMTAGYFVGNGYFLSNLDANSITTGTLSVSRLPANVSFMDISANTFSGDGSLMTFSYLVVGNSGGASNSTLWVTGNSIVTGNVTASYFIGNGSGFTGLNANSITWGTLDSARLPANITVTVSNSMTYTSLTLGNLYVSGNVSAGSFYGNGAFVTNLDANAVTTGTLNPLRLPSSVSFVSVGSNITLSNCSSLGWISGASANSADAALVNYDGRIFLGTSSPANGNVACITADRTGNVGMCGCTAPQYALDVYGTVRASGDVIALSDARVKTNLEEIKNALERISGLRAYTYKRLDASETDNPRKVGLLAQEVANVLPEAVSVDSNGTMAVSYSGVTALCAAGIRELHEIVSSLETRVDYLEKFLCP